MRRISKINIEESIMRQRLIFVEDWLDKIDRITIYFLFSSLLTSSALTIYEVGFDTPNDRFLSIAILPFPILFALYVIYRKATEKKLFKINTKFNKQQNKQMLLDFAENNGLEIYRRSTDCMIFNEPTSDLSPTYKKSMIFIVKDNLVLFTVIQDHFRLNIPVLTTHLFLKHDLEKLFNKV